MQCRIRRNRSFEQFWRAQSGGSAADFFHHLTGVFLEMAPIADCEFARFQIEETQRTDGLTVGRAQGRAGIETKASLSDPGVTGKASISGEVFNHGNFIVRNNVAAYGNIP
jgi:hypothetical protein